MAGLQTTERDILPAVLHSLLECDAERGLLFWRQRDVTLFKDTKGRTAAHACANWNSRFAGKPAFTTAGPDGYMHGCLLWRKYLAHRVIWAMVNGEWPAEQIDHKNGIRDDNRLENLRAASNQQNGMNVKLRADNKSGVCGVRWESRRNRYSADIRVNGKNLFLGRFKDIGEAKDARLAAEKRFGFSARHGTNEVAAV